MDHTPVDVIVVDERHRLPVGRPYVTVAIDVVSRCVVGLVVTLEAPSATSVGLCLARTATGKRAWLSDARHIDPRCSDHGSSAGVQPRDASLVDAGGC